MLLLETLAIALGTSIAKYLVKELLPHGQIAADIIGAGANWLTNKEPTDPAGEEIGKRLKVIYDLSRLPADEKTLVAAEVARTLVAANTDIRHLVAINLNWQTLHGEMVEQRPKVLKELSADAEALYKQMLRVAAEGMTETADKINGFLRVALGQLLSGQAEQADLLAAINDELQQAYQGLARWLREPEEKAARFLSKYKSHLSDHLDKMEPFGIPKRDEIGQKLRLHNAFIGLRVRYRSSPHLLIAWMRALSRDFSGPEKLQEIIAEKLGWGPDDARSLLLITQLLDRGAQAELPRRGRIGLTASSWTSNFYQPQLFPAPDDHWRQVLDKLSHDESFIRDVAFEDAFAGERRIMLEGKAGTGKSSLLQWLAVQAAQDGFPERMTDWKDQVPFFLRLRNCRDGEFASPERWLSLEAKPIAGSMPDGWAHEQLESGRALVLIDGVDEMPRSQRPALLSELQSLVRNYPLARYVVSSRPTAVNEEQWPEWNSWLKEAAFAEVTLQEMDERQLDTFVQQWHEAYAEVVGRTEGHDKHQAALANAPRVQGLFGRRKDLRKLAETPLLAAMICTLYQERGEHIPRHRLELYKECIDMLLERREQKKGVNLSADYVSLSGDEKIALLRALAYWMLDNELTSAKTEEAAEILKGRLPYLNRPSTYSGDDIIRLFVERVELLQEEVVGEISFRHRTFQEYLAADSVKHESNFRALAARAHEDQWRETIILAFGMANKVQQGQLLRGIISKAQRLKTDSLRRQRLLLALACLETGVEVAPQLRREALDANRELFPPHSAEEAELIANAGAMAVEMLAYDPDCPAAIAQYSIQALAKIGGEAALETLTAYLAKDHRLIRRALADSWDGFDREDFTRRILTRSAEWAFSRLPTHEWAQHLAHVEELDVTIHPGDDLTPLTGLSQLASLSLDLSGGAAIDLSPLAGLSQLASLSLDLRGGAALDLSHLAGLSQLASLSLDLRGGAAIDLSPLAGLSQLASLSLDLPGDAAVNLTPLAGLSQLASLSLWLPGDAALDLSPLAGLPQLAYLSLSLRGGAALDLTPLAGLSQLASLLLWLPDDAALDLTPLAGLSQLASLSLLLPGNAAHDLTLLAGLSQLASLSLWLPNDAAHDLTLLAGLSQLASLSLWLPNDAAHDLTLLAGLSQLASLSLDLSGDAAHDLLPLAGLSQLASLSLDLRDGAAHDLTPLAGLSQLASLSLDLSDDAVVDLTPLAGLSQLASLSLDLSGGAAVDLTPLAGLSQLTTVTVSKNLAQELISLLRPVPRRHGLITIASGYFIQADHVDPDDLPFESEITYLPPRPNA